MVKQSTQKKLTVRPPCPLPTFNSLYSILVFFRFSQPLVYNIKEVFY